VTSIQHAKDIYSAATINRQGDPTIAEHRTPACPNVFADDVTRSRHVCKQRLFQAWKFKCRSQL